MMKLVLKVDLNDSKLKKKAMKAVSALKGVESLAISTEKKMLTVIGNIDPVEVIQKLRKLTPVDIETAGPNKKEGEKKEEGKDKDKNKELEDSIRAFYNKYGYYPCYWPPYYPY